VSWCAFLLSLMKGGGVQKTSLNKQVFGRKRNSGVEKVWVVAFEDTFYKGNKTPDDRGSRGSSTEEASFWNKKIKRNLP